MSAAETFYAVVIALFASIVVVMVGLCAVFKVATWWIVRQTRRQQQRLDEIKAEIDAELLAYDDAAWCRLADAVYAARRDIDDMDDILEPYELEMAEWFGGQR
jgi:crotonobetainyl-CoA:carnitine CoA-transferase CaiB-like acyl-CoA transferase